MMLLMPDSASSLLKIRYFSALTDYTEMFNAMKNFTNTRDENTADEIWVLQHEDVLTQGQAGKPEHILKNSDIPLVQSDRGGQVTWHGKGQIIVYFLLDLNRLKWHVRTLVTFAETMMIALLKKYHIDAYAKPDAPGVYVNNKKIGSLGFKIRRGRSYHGFSLNLNCDLQGFQLINPCGYANLEMIRIIDLTPNAPSFRTVQHDILNYLKQTMDFPKIEVINEPLP